MATKTKSGTKGQSLRLRSGQGTKRTKGADAGPANLVIERVEIGSISPDPANLRTHADRSIDAIAASLSRFGQQKPIVLDGGNVCRAGNGTLAAAKSLGWSHVDAVRTNLTGSELTAYAIADNRTADLSEFDEPELARMLESLSIEGIDLAAMGYQDKELARLLKQTEDASPDGGGSTDAPPAGKFMVLLICRDEAEQKELLEKFTVEGRECRALVE